MSNYSLAKRYILVINYNRIHFIIFIYIYILTLINSRLDFIQVNIILYTLDNESMVSTDFRLNGIVPLLSELSSASPVK